MAPPPVSSRASPSSTSNDMDLLSLVGDSMSYMNTNSSTTTSASAPPPTSNSSTTTTTTTTTDSSDSPPMPPSDPSSALADIDLSSLTLQDRALLQPLLDLMQAPTGDGTEEESESDLERRMDEAENVASGLEGMLDSLLARLGGILGEEGLDVLGEEEDEEWEDDKEEGEEEEEEEKGEEGKEEGKSS
ncbi:hypothetical protein BDY24DRAFT_384527 [Mrakia frigida]|uniref:uncharacterized protein n=1 Tax=Mrakia frigida TaxID=29902 RepID=UPI003FCC000F